jgi:mono/diheme cytochrome c family protein
MNKTLGRAVLAAAIMVGMGLFIISNNRATATPSAPSITANPVDAHALYDKKCAECHGKDGQSHTFRGKHTHSRDLSDPQWQDQVTDERIYNSIANGKGKMPGFGKKVSDGDINSLVTFVRSLRK